MVENQGGIHVSKQLPSIAPIKWPANYAGAAPNNTTAPDALVGDLAVDTSLTPYRTWECVNNTASQIWVRHDAPKLGFNITYTSHGLGSGVYPCYLNSVTYPPVPIARIGTAYGKAKADTAANIEVIGMAVAAIDVNTLMIQQAGSLTYASHPFTGPVVMVDPGTAGALTETVPTTAGQFICTVLKVIDANTLEVVNYPAVQVASSTSVTMQGNTFNGNSQLVQTTSDGKLPALSAANLTNFPTLNQSTSGTAAKATNLVGGNGTTLLGAVPYQSAADTTLFVVNTTTTKKFLRQTGDGTNGAAPAWDTIAALDVPTLNQSTTGTAAKATNMVGDGSGAHVGALFYQTGVDTTSLLEPNKTTTKKFLRETGDGTNGTAPAWDTIVASDLPVISTSTATSITGILIGNGSVVGAASAGTDYLDPTHANLTDGNAYKIGSVNMLHKGANSLAGNLVVGNGGASLASGGVNNTAVGSGAAHALATGLNNTFVGYYAAYNTAGGQQNTAIGSNALLANTSGTGHTAIGMLALATVSTGSNNVALGAYAGKYETGSNAFYVDNQDRTDTAGDKAKALLYGVFDATAANQTLTINAALTATYGVNIPTGQTYKIAGVPISSGSGSTTFNITFANTLGTGAYPRTLTVPVPISRVGSTYALAMADSAINVETIGAAIIAVDANTLTIQQNNTITRTAHGYTGPGLFIDPAIAGGITETPPVTAGQYIKPIMRVVDANTLEIVDQLAIQISQNGMYTTMFASTDTRFTAGVITITHGLNQKPLFISVMDGSANPVDVYPAPVYSTSSNDSFTMDFSNFGAFTGYWTLICSKGAGAAITTYSPPATNLFRNADNEIIQRGTSFVSPASGTYTLDGWIHGNATDGTMTLTQDTDVPTVAKAGQLSRHSLKVRVTGADASIGAAQWAGIHQRIEGYDIYPAVGRTLTLSFWAKAKKTGIYCICAANSAFDRAMIKEYTVSVADTWEKKSVTWDMNYSGGTWDFTSGLGIDIYWIFAVGSNFQGAKDTWLSGIYSGTANQVNMMDSTNNYINIAQAKLEIGQVASPFVARSYGEEFERCMKRLYVLRARAQYDYVPLGFTTSTSAGRIYIPFPTVMAAPPTVFASAVGTLRILPAVGSDALATAAALSAATESGAAIYLTQAGTTFTAGVPLRAYEDNATPTTYFLFSCEL